MKEELFDDGVDPRNRIGVAAIHSVCDCPGVVVDGLVPVARGENDRGNSGLEPTADERADRGVGVVATDTNDLDQVVDEGENGLDLLLGVFGRFGF